MTVFQKDLRRQKYMGIVNTGVMKITGESFMDQRLSDRCNNELPVYHVLNDDVNSWNGEHKQILCLAPRPLSAVDIRVVDEWKITRTVQCWPVASNEERFLRCMDQSVSLGLT
jgi:hypothetical protein